MGISPPAVGSIVAGPAPVSPTTLEPDPALPTETDFLARQPAHVFPLGTAGANGAHLFSESARSPAPLDVAAFESELRSFRDFGTRTRLVPFPDPSVRLPVYVNEFWTAKQRAAHSLHEISYRACFKPQLPRFFITRLTRPGDVVYDPFMGRGTTPLEAALLGRRAAGSDLNPLSARLLEPRLDPPQIAEVAARLESLDLERPSDIPEELLAFYHPATLRRVVNLRRELLRRRAEGTLDRVDAWIQMVATNRLTGHSPGFFSVYTLPPNQAASIRSQIRINERRQQAPPERDVKALILRKSGSLLGRFDTGDGVRLAGADPLLLTASADCTPELEDGSVRLVVTSPPFLDIVNYRADNWLRCWFNGVDPDKVALWHWKRAADWQAAMTRVFSELSRVLVPSGLVAFEVGEVRSGRLLLETLVVPAASEAGLEPLLVLVNDQQFTKTSNCWGVDNQRKGTNTNRVVLLRKP